MLSHLIQSDREAIDLCHNRKWPELYPFLVVLLGVDQYTSAPMSIRRDVEIHTQ